jgi:hypothetical protein
LHGFPQTHVLWHRVAQAAEGRLLHRDARPARLRRFVHAPGLPDHSNYSKRAMAGTRSDVMTRWALPTSTCAATTAAAAWRTGWRWTMRLRV